MPFAEVATAETLVRVAAKRAVADAVVALDLVAESGQSSLPDWSPGAHIDLLLPGGLIRQYSLCGSHTDRTRWRVSVLREPNGRGGSAWIHDALGVGDVLPARGPRNHFTFAPSPRCLFIAGGIGITPLLPMIALADRANSDWRLLYGGRSRTSLAFLDELAGYGDRVTVVPQDQHGPLDVAAVVGALARDAEVYCCGPEGLLRAVEVVHAARPAELLHVERFHRGAEPDRPAADRDFELVLRRTGRTLTVPADRSIVQTLERAGVDVLYSCEEGTCGTCETVVCEGRPDHRDSVLTAVERATGDRMMICVSRCLGPRLVLDI
jgi:ferredoxin-NADP reductase